MEQVLLNDTIAAISTPPGMGGIAVIRVSGPRSIQIINNAWKGIDLTKCLSHTLHLGKYYATDGNLIDEAVASIFLAPNSFTGEESVEISVHGSTWIQRELLNDLVRRGVRIANPGEFTQRAFLNGKMDLAQAEGVVDLIASSSKAAHDLAISQTRGKFSQEFNLLRDKLIVFASLIELELDFSEEDVEFADREDLKSLCREILGEINKLLSSYSRGAVLKDGVPVVIAGRPNAGKSSLLNLLLNDDKAIVTDIPGTTRDLIEDTIEINGVLYRFIDTAGLRDTDDTVEGIGVNRALDAIKKAFIVIWMVDLSASLQPQLSELLKLHSSSPKTNIILLFNKADLFPEIGEMPLQTDIQTFLDKYSDLNTILPQEIAHIPNIPFSTKSQYGVKELMEILHELSTAGADLEKDLLLTNARHYESLHKASESLTHVLNNLSDNLSPDLVAQDIRETISHLSTLTGSITSETLLHSIFSRFCIGK